MSTSIYPVQDDEWVVMLDQLRMSDVARVGGKNASLGELIGELSQMGVRVPGGFATTAYAFNEFLRYNQLRETITAMLAALDADDLTALVSTGKKIRDMVTEAKFPTEMETAIRKAYQQQEDAESLSFAVRSSATAEDLPDASFAGQQETYLNVNGFDAILLSIKRVFASLYNDRAISYRVHKGFAHELVAISAGIQRMVRSDQGSAGVMFTLDTESGFRNVVFITSSWGLGETVVQGSVNPDEFYLFKPALREKHFPIIKRSMGSKLERMEFAPAGSPHFVQTVETSVQQRNRFSINDDQAIALANDALAIEAHYGGPMDIEWALDGVDGKLYILQARPETVKSQQGAKVELRYRLKGSSTRLVEGRAIGQKISTGTVRLISSPAQMHLMQPGDVLVTDMTDPNWEPIMKRAAAVVTNRGGRTCHAAIIAREFGIPAIVGCGNATEVLTDGALVTVCCSEGDSGHVYDGLVEIETTEIESGEMPKINSKIMLNIGNPQLAMDFAQIPNHGVGLARIEFIINNNIGVHPRAVLEYPHINAELKLAIESIARGYGSPRQFYIDKLCEGIATIAAAFYPNPVIVRMSDFKSNEYRKLIGGKYYEPEEENPMMGFRGAIRYISQDFAESFRMECEALLRVRNTMGLSNVEIMIPFVRTLNEAKGVIALLAENGLVRGRDGLRLIMMCEIPSNALLADQFLELFDGFSIGSNDLTQLTLGIDRDSGLVAESFNEMDEAVLSLFEKAISSCKKRGAYVGICGQGPSDNPEFAKWLLEHRISSISLNPDSVIDTWKLLGNYSNH